MAQDLDSTANFEAALTDCAAGQTAAVAQIYVTEGNRLRSIARRIVRDRDRAEDVVHDAFIQILRDAGNFDPSRGSARAWIYAIVRNTALKSLRVTHREVRVERDEPGSICDDPQSAARSLADGIDLRACLERLEPKRRASLILAIVEHRTHTEIAEYLGVPVGTIKAWIRRELIALRKRLE